MTTCVIDPEVSSACSSEEYVTASSDIAAESGSEVSSLEMVMDVSSLTLSDSAIELEDKSLESDLGTHGDIVKPEPELDKTSSREGDSAAEDTSDHGDDNEVSCEDITLKDYEQKSLQTLALERKRIIENQVVRRKKIDKWTLSEKDLDVDDSSDMWLKKGETKFQRILNQPRQATSESAANGATTETSQESVDSQSKSHVVEEVVSSNLDCKNVEVENVVATQEHVMDYSAAQMSEFDGAKCDNSAGLDMVKDSLTSVQPDPVNALQHSSTPDKDSVDCTSILEKKEQLKRYWEERIMAEQDLISFGDVTDASSRSPLARKGFSSSDVNGNEESRTTPNSHGEENRTKSSAPPTPNGGHVMNGSGGEHDSLMDSLDDEVEQKPLDTETLVERENREFHHQASNEVNDEHQQHVLAEQNADLLCDEGSEGAIVTESAAVTEQVELSEDEVRVVKEHLHEITTTCEYSESYESVSCQSTEMPSTNGQVQQDTASKPQVIGETYRSAQSANGASPKPQQAPSTLVNGHHVSLKNTGSYNANNAESLIAMEIRELREREEELKQMRERLMSKSISSPQAAPTSSAIDSPVSPSPDTSITSKINGGANLDSLETNSSGRNTPLYSPDEGSNVTRAISLDSLQPGQNYNLGYAFGHRRKDRITVKPLTDQESDDEEKKRPVFKVLNESPIEREIRLAQEREEALRREKAAVLGESVITTKDRNQKVDSTPAQRPSTLHPSVVAKPKLGVNSKLGSGDTQKVIATVRIQQEIEEQTQRELALKAAGSIQTISHERIDSKISTKLIESSTITNGVQASSPSPKSPMPTATSYSLPDVEICEKTPNGGATTNGSTCHHHKSTNNGVTSPCSSSSTSNSSGTGVPVVASRRFVPNASVASAHRPGGISMQKFISSKGKEFVFSTFSKTTTTNGVNGTTMASPTVDYYEIKPPQVRKNPDGGIQSIRKGLVPAESKIQEELKEMKAREDELKRQRARSLNLATSQPNLSSSSDEKEVSETSQSPDIVRSVSVSDAIDHLRERCTSNPNLQSVASEVENGRASSSKSEKSEHIGGPRRRSTLIAQWEQMIQGAETTGLRT